tara:strand:+ start:191 stop:517 length:327 start_codon:yes stop_codon:yes gene_type:complete
MDNFSIEKKDNISTFIYFRNSYFEDLIISYFIYFIIFIAYLEISPKLKNVWIRCNSDNVLQICPAGIWNMLKKPFSNIYFWYPQFWDLNYYIGGLIFSALRIFLSNNN